MPSIIRCVLSQFPILQGQDSFTDGHGPHTAGDEINIPIRQGPAGLSGPFNKIKIWLDKHIPDLQLPVNLENMPEEDRNALFKKIIVEVEGGEKQRLMDVLGPLLRPAHWKTLHPDTYKLPYHYLALPTKNMFIEVSRESRHLVLSTPCTCILSMAVFMTIGGTVPMLYCGEQGDMQFVVTTPEGAQEFHKLNIRPQETWGHASDRFFHNFPQYDREKTKLTLFDSEGKPTNVPAESPVYVGVKEAVQQHHRVGFLLKLRLIRWI